MAIYPSTNIFVNLLDPRSVRNLEEVKTYLEIKGKPYHQNCNNQEIKEFHYFCGNSAVFIKQFEKRANIDIFASDDDIKSSMKTSIEEILAKD
jgi:hypothetical protein